MDRNTVIQVNEAGRGPRGAKGDQGLPGINGTNGKSAYQSAVDNGFTGSEADWVDYFAEVQAARTVAIANAATAQGKFAADKKAAAFGNPRMFDRLLWPTNFAANEAALRMPGSAFKTSTEMHLFAMARYGTEAATGAGAENGFRAGWRKIIWDFEAETALRQPVTVLEQPSDWTNHHGSSGTFSVEKISQGIHAGEIELLWGHQTPENDTYSVAGSTMDLHYATSIDSYTGITELRVGDTWYTDFPGTPMPPNQRGAFPLPQGLVEIPAGEVNAGRRVCILGLNVPDGTYHNFTISAEKDQLFSEGFAVNPIIPGLTGHGPAFINEASLTYRPGDIAPFHIYLRNDDVDVDYHLTHRGPVHASSPDGLGSWGDQGWLPEPQIGNVQIAAVSLPDGAGRTILYGSTQLFAGIRNEGAYIISYDGKTFVAKTPDPFAAAVNGYSKLIWHIAPDGRVFIIHIYESSSGYNGFNFDSQIRGRAMELDWLLRRAELI